MEFLKDIIKSFPSVLSFVWGSVFLVVIIFPPLLLLLNQFIELNWVKGLIISLLFISWFLFWIINFKKWPKYKPNKIGIVIGIKAENDKQKVRIKNDFIFAIDELIKKNNLSGIINVLTLNDFQTHRYCQILQNLAKRMTEILQGIDLYKIYPSEKKWARLKKSLKSQFFIYGDVKERMDNEMTYFLDLDAQVIHPPIILGEKNPYAEAFKYIWNRKISFRENIEHKGFQFSADVVFIAAKYVLAIAAFISRDPLTALKLHESMLGDLKKFNPLPPNLVRVQKDLLNHLSDECGVLASHYRLTGDIPKAKEYLSKAIGYNSHSGHPYNLKSIFDFTIDNDIDEAIKSSYLSKKYSKDDGTWRYNLGFLLMYKEDFQEALIIYDQIAKYSISVQNDKK